jgi:hypothetical protein
MYSNMLYMKTRVTFRISPELAESLRDLPNQTLFVERALKEALRERCPACGGSGRKNEHGLWISNFRAEQIPALSREAALELKGLVSLARHAAATRVELRRARKGAVGYRVTRGDEELLSGELRH